MVPRLALVVALLIALGALAQPRLALADDDPAAAKRRGDAAMDATRYDEALQAYEAALRQRDDPALLYNIGRALQGLGRNAAALDRLEAFKARAPAELLARVSGLDGLLADLRSRVAHVTLRISPPAARVLLDGIELGQGPRIERRIDAGTHALSVSADGYLSSTRVVQLRGGSVVDLELPLARADTKGLLVVSSPTPGAQVLIDGQPAGDAPAELPVDPGLHRVEVRAGDHHDATRQVVVAVGERRAVDVSLSRRAPASRWWLWTGIGVVVVGAAVTTALLLSRDNESTRTGSLQPGSVPVPLVSF